MDDLASPCGSKGVLRVEVSHTEVNSVNDQSRGDGYGIFGLDASEEAPKFFVEFGRALCYPCMCTARKYTFLGVAQRSL